MQLFKVLLFLLVVCMQTSVFAQAKIPFSALHADNEGIFGIHPGAMLPPNLCAPPTIEPPFHTYRYISSAESQGTFPGYKSAGHLRNDILDGVSGFPDFMAALNTHNLDITKINLRFSQMEQDLANWQFIDGVDTRIYSGGQFQLVYIDGAQEQLIISGNMPRTRMIVKYNNFANCFDDQIYGHTQYTTAVDASQNSSPAIQALAQALLDDISIEGIKMQFTSVQPAIVGAINQGAVFQVNAGVIIKGKAPFMDLEFEFPAQGQNNDCMAIANVMSTASGNWLHFRDEFNNVVASVFDSEAMGSMSASIYKHQGDIRESNNGIEILNKNIEISPENQPSSGQILVRLYFSGLDWDLLVAANDGDANDPSTFDELKISKFSADCGANYGNNAQLLDIVDWGQIGAGAAGGYYIDVEVNSFSSFFIHGPSTSSAVLPVRLENFESSYNNNAIKLNWLTSMEHNNSGFEVQRSTDGRNFKKIGWVAANTRFDYQFIDHDILAQQTYYYRLKQIDVDGSFEFSAIRQQKTGSVTASPPLSIYPNPTNSKLYINSELAYTHIVVYDLLGQERLQTKLEGSNSINIASFEQGVYQLIAYDAAKNIVHKELIVKQ